MRELNAEKVRDMTVDEIETRIRELHEEIFNLRFRNAMRQLQNPVLIRERRRDIARMRTILVEHRKGIRPLAGHPGHEASGAVKAAPAKAAPAKAASAKAAAPALVKASKESKAKAKTKTKTKAAKESTK